MVEIRLIQKIQEFINFALIENKISLINIKLILHSIFYSVRALLLKERNIASEIYSYESLFFIKKEDPIGFLESCRRNDNAFPDGIINEVLNLRDNIFKIKSLFTLEIGSGPNSNLSYWADKGLLRVIAIDPLADIYRNIMKKLGYKYPITPIKIKAEELMNYFKGELFHIIFAQNSLDHAEDPLLCFRNAYKLLKKRGLLFICSNVKEGTRKFWLGMHKFDIYVENNHLYLANEKGEIFNFIDEDMSLDFIFYETYLKNNVASFEAVFRKN
jgi:SAM-dependent methyltransferase